jgi:hypothetical protein
MRPRPFLTDLRQAIHSCTETDKGRTVVLKAFKSPLELLNPLFIREPIALNGSAWRKHKYPKDDRPDLEIGVREDGSDFFSVLDPDLTKLKTHLALSSLTISGATVTVRGISFLCRILVTDGGTFKAIDCAFRAYDATVEFAVDVFKRSKGEFSHCYFYQNGQAAIVFRDRAVGRLKNCSFTETRNASVLVLNSSVAMIENCQFEEATKFSVCFDGKSKGKVLRSVFGTQAGMGVFMANKAECAIDCCWFNRCQGGAVRVWDWCKVYIQRSEFTQVEGACVYGGRNCVLEVAQCTFDDCHANGVHFEWSTGFVQSCSFGNFTLTPLIVSGPSANPILLDCRISDCHAMAVVARDASTPIFYGVTLDGVESQGFSISDFSQPIVKGCVLMNIDGEPFSVFNGAQPRIFDSVIDIDLVPRDPGEDRAVFFICTAGRPEVIGTIYSSETVDVVRVAERYHGAFDPDLFRQNRLMRGGGSFVQLYDSPRYTFFFGPGPLEHFESLSSEGVPWVEESPERTNE